MKTDGAWRREAFGQRGQDRDTLSERGRAESRGASVTGSRAARSGPSRSESPLSSAAFAHPRPRGSCPAPVSPGSMARRAVGAVARAHRRWRRLPAPPAPRTCRVAVGLALVLVLAVSFALPAHALDRVIASWWEAEKYIDPSSSDYRPMKSHDWAQAFKTGWCEGEEGVGFELKFVSIKFQEPSTDGATDRLTLTLHRGGTHPGGRRSRPCASRGPGSARGRTRRAGAT